MIDRHRLFAQCDPVDAEDEQRAVADVAHAPRGILLQRRHDDQIEIAVPVEICQSRAVTR